MVADVRGQPGAPGPDRVEGHGPPSGGAQGRKERISDPRRSEAVVEEDHLAAAASGLGERLDDPLTQGVGLEDVDLEPHLPASGGDGEENRRERRVAVVVDRDPVPLGRTPERGEAGERALPARPEPCGDTSQGSGRRVLAGGHATGR